MKKKSKKIIQAKSKPIKKIKSLDFKKFSTKVFLSAPHMSGHEMKYIKKAFQENWITPQGPNVTDFENEICQFVLASKKPQTDLFAVAMSSGTAAIHIALRLLGIKASDEVFCSSATFIASAYPILYEKAVPVFIDSEPTTWNMCPASLQKAFEKKSRENKLPKAVITVDLFGMSSRYDEITEICNRYKVPIIQDAAEALGSKYNGQACGLQGEYGVFSFNGNKIITTSSGGALLTRSKVMADKALYYVTQARDKALYYLHSDVGYNYRLSNISAGIGLGQMHVLKSRVNRRREVFEFYRKNLSGHGLEFLPEPKGFFSNRWLSTALLSQDVTANTGLTAMGLIEKLHEYNIEARPIWKPMHTQPIFAKNEFFSVHPEKVSEIIFDRGLCLPSCTDMTQTTQAKVCEIVKTIISS